MKKKWRKETAEISLSEDVRSVPPKVVEGDLVKSIERQDGEPTNLSTCSIPFCAGTESETILTPKLGHPSIVTWCFVWVLWWKHVREWWKNLYAKNSEDLIFFCLLCAGHVIKRDFHLTVSQGLTRPEWEPFKKNFELSDICYFTKCGMEVCVCVCVCVCERERERERERENMCVMCMWLCVCVCLPLSLSLSLSLSVSLYDAVFWSILIIWIYKISYVCPSVRPSISWTSVPVTSQSHERIWTDFFID